MIAIRCERSGALIGEYDPVTGWAQLQHRVGPDDLAEGDSLGSGRWWADVPVDVALDENLEVWCHKCRTVHRVSGATILTARANRRRTIRT